MLVWFFRESGQVLLRALYFCDFPGERGAKAPCPSSESAHDISFFKNYSTNVLKVPEFTVAGYHDALSAFNRWFYN